MKKVLIVKEGRADSPNPDVYGLLADTYRGWLEGEAEVEVVGQGEAEKRIKNQRADVLVFIAETLLAQATRLSADYPDLEILVCGGFNADKSFNEVRVEGNVILLRKGTKLHFELFKQMILS